MWSNWNAPVLVVGTQNGTATVKKYWQFLIKLNLHLPYVLAIPLFLSEMKAYGNTNTYVIVALFIITKNRK